MAAEEDDGDRLAGLWACSAGERFRRTRSALTSPTEEFAYVQPAGTPKRIYFHVIEFVRRRAVGAGSTTDFDAPGDMATRLRPAGLIDGRLK